MTSAVYHENKATNQTNIVGVVTGNSYVNVSFHEGLKNCLSIVIKYLPICSSVYMFYTCTTVMILCFRTQGSGQSVQTQIRLLLEEQSDQGIHCLLFHLHLFYEIPKGLASFLEF